VSVYPPDAEFEGIRHAMESYRTKQNRANMLVVHGQGFHCIGYSRTLINNLTRKLSLVEVQPQNNKAQSQKTPESADKDMGECVKRIKSGTGEGGKGQRSIGAVQQAPCAKLRKYGRACEVIGLFPGPGKTARSTHGYLKVREFHADGKKRGTLRIYELTWDDPVTRPIKQAYLGFDWAEEPSTPKKTGLPERPAAAKNRAVVNDLMKDFFNTWFSDPVLYVGAHKPRIQAVVLQALCHIVGDDDLEHHHLHRPNAQRDICNLRKFKYSPENKLDKDVFEFINSNEIIIVSYSLGSKIVFDALNVLGGPRIDRNPCEAGPSKPSYLGNMAPDDLLTYQHSVKLGEIMGFFKTCKERDKAEGETPSDIPLAVAAKEFYTKPFKPVDVELNIAVPWLGIFADPIQAHTGHQFDETVLDFMVIGRSKSRDPQNK
jgi:hypothetical protein